MEANLSHEQQFELQMQLNASYERLADWHTRLRLVYKGIYEEEQIRDRILGDLGLRSYHERE